jgi:hypothetical protein
MTVTGDVHVCTTTALRVGLRMDLLRVRRVCDLRIKRPDDARKRDREDVRSHIRPDRHSYVFVTSAPASMRTSRKIDR